MIRLSTVQRYWIAFLFEENKLSPGQIRKHPKLIKPDGSLFQQKVINHWIKRWIETGDVEQLKKSGRPRILDKDSEQKVIEYIKSNPKVRYRKVKYRLRLKMHRWSLNRYALRNKISEYS